MRWITSRIILMASTYLTSQTLYSRVLVAAFCVLTIVLTVLLRASLRKLHGLLRAGRFDHLFPADQMVPALAKSLKLTT